MSTNRPPGATGAHGGDGRVRRAGVFSIGTTTAQLAWAALGPGTIRFRVAGPASPDREVHSDGGPGAVEIDGLPVADTVEIRATAERMGAAPRPFTVTTLRPPPGEELYRFATISDLHVGERGFGYWHRIREPETIEPYTVRCTEAAIGEAAAWGAELLVVKGDITNKGLAEEWHHAARLLADAPLPVLAMPGNHDVKDTAELDTRAVLTARAVHVASPVAVRDVPGLRIVALDTTVANLHAGRVHDIEDELLTALADAARDGRPALVAMHHHLQTRFVPARWPPGVPILASRRLLGAIGRANPHTLVTSGHTHRHRRHQLGPIVTTTVGSVKDYPGVWAAYVVHEGGIRQEVRRVARPDVIRWTERSGRALLGAYRWWTPGTLASRCFTLDWSE